MGFAYWSSGRAPESEAPLGVMREHLGDVDLWTELMALRALVGVIEPETRKLGARMAALADQLGAPAMIASARFYQGLGASDADAAVALYLEGVRLSRAANANLAECQNLQGLQSTTAGRGHPQALRYCHDSLVRIYELRYWLHLWRVVAGAAKMLADRGDIETAGTIAGHLKEHHFAWGDATTRRIVRSTLTAVENHPDGPSLMRAGAAADREQIVQLTIEAIERAMEAEASVSARLQASFSPAGRRGVRDRFRRGARRWSAAAVEELGPMRVDDPATEPPSPLD